MTSEILDAEIRTELLPSGHYLIAMNEFPPHYEWKPGDKPSLVTDEIHVFTPGSASKKDQDEAAAKQRTSIFSVGSNS